MAAREPGGGCPSARTSQATLLSMLLLSLAVVAWGVGGAGATSCCPGDAVFLRHAKSCAAPDGGAAGSVIKRNVNCTHGTYLVDPEMDPEDQIVILDDGQLRVGSNDSVYLVPSHMYCVTRVQMERDNASSLRRVAYVCFSDEAEGILATSRYRHILYGTLQAISVVFLFVTFTVYLLIPELRDLQGRCIMTTVFCQMIGYLLLLITQFEGENMKPTSCVTSAFVLYFWMIASFFWLSVTSFNVWRSVWYKKSPLDDTRLFWCYCAFGWACPCIFLVATLTTHHHPVTDANLIRPNFGIDKCWFKGETEQWAYFFGPVTVLLACNVLFFVLTAWRLWRRGGNTVPGIRASRYKCLLYTRLFLIMGILWIFEVISFVFDETGGLWLIPDVLNCLQGVYIFLIVVCRKRVVLALSRREWSRAAVVSLCPSYCTRGPDDEEEEAMIAALAQEETYVPMETSAT